MRYISTRGSVESIAFSEAILAGQASDGGLFLPERFPDLGKRLEELKGLSFVDLAFEIVRPYANDIDESILYRILEDSFSTFDTAEVTPLVDIGDMWLLELFHGPTLAFKDVALQVLGRLFEHVLGERELQLNILGATSGDTGIAAIAGVRGRKNMQIFVLFPEGRTSRLQELQMTTVADENVHSIAIEGTFDDCQKIMKSIFNDVEFKIGANLGAVNSINWGRLMVQIVYYFFAALKFDGPVAFSVPTGNFGNILSGIIAMRMGAPIQQLILATNENDILARFFATGHYKKGEVHHTTSPSMDIQVASNLERFIFLHIDRDPGDLQRFMDSFARNGEATLPGEGVVDVAIHGTRVNTSDAMSTIREVFEARKYILDPHTSIGVAAARRRSPEIPCVCLATAHPAKFPEAVAEATGGVTPTHPSLDKLVELPTRKVVLPATESHVREFLVENMS